MKILQSIISKLDESMKEAKRSNPDERSISDSFNFGNYVISFYLTKDLKEVQVDHKSKDIYLENVEAYLTRNVLNFDDIEVSESSVWDCNGFRDESDYVKYKYM